MHTLTRNKAHRRAALLLILGLVGSLGLAPLTFAQPSPEQMQERMAAQRDTLLKALNVTDDQRAPVLALLEESDQKRMDLFAKARESGSFEGLREDMAALNEETETKLAELLTEDQMGIYREVMEARAAERRRRRGM
jgi:hypothetical protein